MSDALPEPGMRSETDSPLDRAAYWLLVSGNRFVVGALAAAALFVATFALVALDLVAVGPDSNARSVFGSGFVAGILTVITIALSINQLILSRVFGTPDELTDRLEGSRDFRERLRELADEPSAPNDPGEFLGLIAATLDDRTSALREAIEDSEWDQPDEVDRYLDGIEEYARSIDEDVEPDATTMEVLDVILASDYARNLTATEHVANKFADELSPTARTHLDAVDGLLELVTVTRQLFKTVALQQDFARLARVVAYTGLLSLFVSVVLGLLYRTNAVTVPEGTLPLVVSAGLAVIVVPLTVFLAYILRAATIARYTVSVGAFTPHEAFSEEEEG